MFDIRTGNYSKLEFEDDVKFWGLAYCPSDKYLTLDFGKYYIKLEWGYLNV